MSATMIDYNKSMDRGEEKNVERGRRASGDDDDLNK